MVSAATARAVVNAKPAIYPARQGPAQRSPVLRSTVAAPAVVRGPARASATERTDQVAPSHHPAPPADRQPATVGAVKRRSIPATEREPAPRRLVRAVSTSAVVHHAKGRAGTITTASAPPIAAVASARATWAPVSRATGAISARVVPASTASAVQAQAALSVRVARRAEALARQTRHEMGQPAQPACV
jgi:hypothetical protein